MLNILSLLSAVNQSCTSYLNPPLIDFLPFLTLSQSLAVLSVLLPLHRRISQSTFLCVWEDPAITTLAL